ncbi:hypothetical protein FEM03_16175 [Phragmitibacter flavus]|uniref:PEP-CTERM sorting domain-containing protein n=1 Tax=Phragmitibacter flavus TaxID=2576071 RepID=A0A5R8KD56_9BACT|nr:autotransporter-associated beta strand repeat-containing protein [Phragmitibacter flavus]TLD69855.1 hypothetical protein FEM03_16175 [Phragmitibacter flavus]
MFANTPAARSSIRQLAALLMAGVLSLSSTSFSAEFFWDANTGAAGNQNGSGLWNNDPASLNWTPSVAGTNGAWINASDSIANLSASAGYTNPAIGGTITLGENIFLNQLIFGSQAGAYQITPASGTQQLQFDGIAPAIHSDSTQPLTISTGITSTGPLKKTGSGRIILNSPTSLADLNIQNGAVQLNTSGTLPSTTNLTLGTPTTAGTLDVRADQSLASLTFQSRSNATTNLVNIAADTTLTVNGALTNGILDGTSASNTTNTTVSGAGHLIVNTPTANLTVSSGNDTGTSTQLLNLANLEQFTSTTNNIYVGRATTNTSAFASTGRPQSTLVLARNNELTANNLLLGINTQVTSSSFLDLGTTNTLNINTIVAGGGRSIGTMRFTAGTINPTLTLRGQTGGTSRTNIFVADSRNASSLSTTGGSSTSEGHLNFTGGTVDLLIDNLNLALGGTDNGGFNGGAYGKAIGTFTFGGTDSSVDINHLNLGIAVSTNLVAANSPDPVTTTEATFTMNGGFLVVNNSMTLGISQDPDSGNQQAITSTFNLNAGVASINSDIILGSHQSSGTGPITATLNLNGGQLSINGDIVRGDTNTIGTVNLNGTHLNLNNHAIGDAINPVTLNLQSGLLSNLSELNGGADLVKTGPGTLILSGTNTHTGNTVIENGRLLVDTTTALQNTAGIDVRSGGTFDFNDRLGGTLTLSALTLADGSAIGAQLGSATGSIQTAAVVQTATNAQIAVNIHHNGPTPPPASSVILDAAGGLTANGATYSLGIVYNNTDFTVAIVASPTQITANTTAAGPLTAAYWKGGFTPANNVWSASNGSTLSNWSATIDGATDTGLVPGAMTDVYFSATTSTLPATTVLGADMTFKTLNISTATPLTLDDAENSLTLTGDPAITVANTSGAVTLNTNLFLTSAVPTLHVDNTAGLTLTGLFFADSATTITKTGTGTLFLTPTFTDHSAKFNITGGTLAINSATALGVAPVAFTADQLRLDNGTLRALASFRIDDPTRGITLGSQGGTFQVDAGSTLGIDTTITSTGTLIKTGLGTLEITETVTSTGGTTLRAGTLSLIGANNTLPSNRAITFDAATATLNLNNTSQTVSSLTFNTHTGIGAMNLAITGNGGTLINNNNSTATQFFTADQAKPLNVDMNGLSTYTHNGSSQIFSIGLNAGPAAHFANGTTAVSTVRLAQTNTITASSIRLGDNVGSSGGGLSTLLLGQTNTLNANSFMISNSRSSGVIRFADNLIDPTVTIRATNGTSAVSSWTMGTLNNFENSTWTSTANFTGGTLNALITTLALGSVNDRQGTLNATFTMDRGLMTVTSLNMGFTSGTDTRNPGIRAVNSVFNLIGDGTLNIATLTMARNTANVANASSNPDATATFNVSAGTANIGSGGILIGRADTTGYDSIATLNLTGGTVNVSGNIVKENTGVGNVNSTIRLQGATLNLNGNNIGDASRPIDNLIFINGTLQNIAQINGGGAISKTGGTDDTLILAGTNTFTGATNVNGGRYLVHGTHSGGGSYTIASGATLGGDGSVSLATGQSIQFLANATLIAGDGSGPASHLSLTTSLSGSSLFDDASLVQLRILADPGSGGTDHSLDLTTADTLNFNGNVNLNLADLQVLDPLGLALGFVEGDTWRLFDWDDVATAGFGTANNVFGDFFLPTLNSGFIWDTSQLYTDGTITVAVPEPGRALLLFIGLTLPLLIRRRHRAQD